MLNFRPCGVIQVFFCTIKMNVWKCPHPPPPPLKKKNNKINNTKNKAELQNHSTYMVSLCSKRLYFLWGKNYRTFLHGCWVPLNRVWQGCAPSISKQPSNAISFPQSHFLQTTFTINSSNKNVQDRECPLTRKSIAGYYLITELLSS